jgi:hypothetical protein
MTAVYKRHPIELPLYGVQNFWNAMADTDNAGPAGTIEVAFSGGVPDVNSLGAIGHGVGFLQVSIKYMFVSVHGIFLLPLTFGRFRR